MSSNWEEDDDTKALVRHRDFQKARSERFESGFIKDLALKRRPGSRSLSESLFEDVDDQQVPLEKQNPTSELKDEFFECFGDEVSCYSSAVGPLPSLTFANLEMVDQFKSKELKRKEQHTVLAELSMMTHVNGDAIDKEIKRKEQHTCLAELSMMTHVNGDAIDKERLCAFETAMTSATEERMPWKTWK